MVRVIRTSEIEDAVYEDQGSKEVDGWFTGDPARDRKRKRRRRRKQQGRISLEVKIPPTVTIMPQKVDFGKDLL